MCRWFGSVAGTNQQSGCRIVCRILALNETVKTSRTVLQHGIEDCSSIHLWYLQRAFWHDGFMCGATDMQFVTCLLRSECAVCHLLAVLVDIIVNTAVNDCSHGSPQCMHLVEYVAMSPIEDTTAYTKDSPDRLRMLCSRTNTIAIGLDLHDDRDNEGWCQHASEKASCCYSDCTWLKSEVSSYRTH